MDGVAHRRQPLRQPVECRSGAGGGIGELGIEHAELACRAVGEARRLRFLRAQLLAECRREAEQLFDARADRATCLAADMIDPDPRLVDTGEQGGGLRVDAFARRGQRRRRTVESGRDGALQGLGLAADTFGDAVGSDVQRVQACGRSVSGAVVAAARIIARSPHRREHRLDLGELARRLGSGRRKRRRQIVDARRCVG